MAKQSARPKPSKARKEPSTLAEPCATPTLHLPNRNEWIEQIFNDFVNPIPSNRMYYRVILETLWPEGHGIPGPWVTEDQLRAAINHYRRTHQFGRNPDRDYLDVFRRVRELRGEEALSGIFNRGKTYQLANLTVGEKRAPRISLSNEDWETILQRYDFMCANCKRREPEVRFQQDHKILRLRADKTSLLAEGVDGLDNWQPLCDECNNFKSTSCRNCNLNCFECPWAFPEKFKALRLSPRNTARFLEHAQASGADPDELLNKIVEEYIDGSLL